MLSKIRQGKDRILQLIAFHAPGAKSLRVRLHRWRGVKIGQNVWIGYQVLLDTSRPDLISVGNNVIISVRAMLIAHFRGPQGITIEDDTFIGPGAIILPNVTIGRGAVVTAGSVVSSSVAANDRGARKSRPPNCHLWSSVGRKDKHGAVFALTAATENAHPPAGAIDMIGRRAGLLDRSTSCILGFMKALARVRGHGLRGLAGTTKHLSS